MADEPNSDNVFPPLTARALVLGERIDTAGLERRDALSTVPLAFRVGDQGMAVVSRYGVVVLIGLDPVAEDEVLRGIASRVSGPFEKREEESITLAPAAGDERVDADGVVRIADRSPARLLIAAHVVAVSALLAHHERQVEEVLDTVEPWAGDLAHTGRRHGARRKVIRLIGQALLVQHRVSGRVAVGDKPDLLWDRPDLERLYARLANEFELKERAEVLNDKLGVIGQTARLMTDLIDTERSLRLEAAIVVLIVLELGLTLFQMAQRLH
ncbi:RMD1 family protein [Phenylobacterium sp.]|uniref:RMD1 family protein n=1 Tax=Phenylobacterium sp. TaxID=1871053 RepID=UPI0025D7C419|nr:RMD1 family protein [Phenylobacterium sp.]